MTGDDTYIGSGAIAPGLVVFERGDFAARAATYTLMPWVPNPRSRPAHRRYYAVHTGPCEVMAAVFDGIDYAAWRAGLPVTASLPGPPLAPAPPPARRRWYMTATTDDPLTTEERLAAYLARWPLLTESEARRELGLAAAVADPTAPDGSRSPLVWGVPGRPDGVRVVAVPGETA